MAKKEGISSGFSVEERDKETAPDTASEAVSEPAVRSEEKAKVRLGQVVGYRHNGEACVALVTRKTPLTLSVFSSVTPHRFQTIVSPKLGMKHGQYWLDVEELEAAIAVELRIKPLLESDAPR